MKLIITRHGRTEGNIKRILADVHDPLAPEGIKQAEAVSERLKDEKIDVIFSSPLIRAKKTAQIIAKHHPGTKFIVVDELREMELGSYTNKCWDDVDWDLMPDDVENRTSLYERGKVIIERVLEEYPTCTVLFVAHNAINKAMIRFLRKWHPEDRQPIPQGNTAITIFEISAEERKEIIFNCTKHVAR
jgi:probable phosphoglycerate mutase